MLEAQAIHVIREVAAETERAALLFSGGKDSAVMAWLAHRAFWPAPIPFDVLHVDTGHNFPEVLAYRDEFLAGIGSRPLVASLPRMIADGQIREPANTVGRNRLQSAALLRTVAEHRFEALLGGARRDEEKARAKERVFSFRDAFGQWDPRDQRPELWDLFNARVNPKEHVRAFPLSNWTEMDVWQYIDVHGIALPSLYYAHRRRVFERDGMLFTASDFLPPREDEPVREEHVRFRTVGDMTCTGAVRSRALTPKEVMAENAASGISERGGSRADDRFAESAMEDRKREGYF
ncbi:sulfate adenylyltransferase subunit CysD [Streptomyces sp. NPDC059224]|uniref:sulfate adenylyltransferase subunit CysD n=1 Tax=Streptomyces sp. NPDC059224 TaxID=3346775 RepID=UPI0036B74029